jgi:hypothetical protein
MVEKKKLVKRTPRPLKWTDSKEQRNDVVHRWLDSNKGDIISVVTGNSKGNMRIGIDGEIRCSIGRDAFSIPCSLSIVDKLSTSEIVAKAMRMYERRKK